MGGSWLMAGDAYGQGVGESWLMAWMAGMKVFPSYLDNLLT